MKTIVLGYDETEHADRALERTIELTRVLGAHVIVVGVAPALVPAAHGIGPIDPADPPSRHRDQLEHAKELFSEHAIDVDTQVALGDPADAILEIAESHDADLIVVGAGKAGLLERLLGQSVSGAVQRWAHCDVLVVH